MGKEIQKTKNATATSEESGTKAGYFTGPLHTAPPKGKANHLSHLSSWTPGLTFYPHRPIRNQLTPHSGSDRSKEPIIYLF